MAVGPSAASVGSIPWPQVDCDKHDDLCTRFGVTGDGEPCFGPCQLHPLRSPPVPALDRDSAHTRSPLLADADATGTPQLLWFRNGTFVGAYEGEHDAKAIKTWAAQKGSADVDAGAE